MDVKSAKVRSFALFGSVPGGRLVFTGTRVSRLAPPPLSFFLPQPVEIIPRTTARDRATYICARIVFIKWLLSLNYSRVNTRCDEVICTLVGGWMQLQLCSRSEAISYCR